MAFCFPPFPRIWSLNSGAVDLGDMPNLEFNNVRLARAQPSGERCQTDASRESRQSIDSCKTHVTKMNHDRWQRV